ncbi:MAG: ParB/RepB/Spo0J family partition protein [Firmicutes bacterium]|nr:ParB/RepB/Spo0J family partition protein [Bacillota bacterium]
MKGLGKGLGALLSIYDDENEEDNKVIKPTANKKTTDLNTSVNTALEVKKVLQEQEIDINLIDANINQPRKTFDATALQELSDSIKVHGIIQPIVVNKTGSRFMIIAGERRWRAAKMVGLLKVPAVVKEYTAKQVAEISIIENIQREDLNDIEVARGIDRLMKEYKLTQEQVSVRLGKNRSTIANTLRLLTLPADVVSLVETNRLSAGHARCLVVLENKEKQIKLATQASNNKMSVRDLEKLVKSITDPTPKQKEAAVQSLELRNLVNTMQRVFATKVGAIGNDNKGRIYIDYFSQDDLNRIESIITKK